MALHEIAAATALSIALQLGCVAFPPVQRVMGLVALAPLQLAIVGAALLATLLFGEVTLRFLRRPSVSFDSSWHETC